MDNEAFKRRKYLQGNGGQVLNQDMEYSSYDPAATTYHLKSTRIDSSQHMGQTNTNLEIASSKMFESKI